VRVKLFHLQYVERRQESFTLIWVLPPRAHLQVTPSVAALIRFFRSNLLMKTPNCMEEPTQSHRANTNTSAVGPLALFLFYLPSFLLIALKLAKRRGEATPKMDTSIPLSIYNSHDIEQLRRNKDKGNITRIEINIIDPRLPGIVARLENLQVLRLNNRSGASSTSEALSFLLSFLPLIQSNTSIRSLVLSHWKLSVEVFCSLLGTDNALTELTFWGCEWDRGAHPSATTISQAFQRNTKIRTLTLHWVDANFLRSMLKGLLANTTIKTLVFGVGTSMQQFTNYTAEMMRKFLKDTSTIQRFELTGTYRATAFRPLALGLIASQSVSEIKFAPCNMWDELSVRCFHQILSTKQNLRYLSLDDDGRYSNWIRDQDIVSSLERNYGILTVSISSNCRLQLDEPHEERLKKLLFRNARLLQWTENPTSVPRLLWPEALQLAMAAGKDTLYRSLLETVGRSSESLRRRGRKRKQRDFFVPS